MKLLRVAIEILKGLVLLYLFLAFMYFAPRFHWSISLFLEVGLSMIAVKAVWRRFVN